MRGLAIMLAALLLAAATFGQGMEPIPFTNPKGQEPSDLVKQVMQKYGIEEEKPAFIAISTSGIPGP